MTKADLAAAVYKHLPLSRTQSLEIVETMFEVVKEELEKGEDVKLSGFGKFASRRKKSRVGRNPRTGREVEISARRVVTFSPSPLMLAKKKPVPNLSTPQGVLDPDWK
ncbi:MAG: integration host factor subunit alpha [Magnetococcales bacterium]|nr:integration host factor subunit alpha [Magnetococcales bacterium]